MSLCEDTFQDSVDPFGQLIVRMTVKVQQNKKIGSIYELPMVPRRIELRKYIFRLRPTPFQYHPSSASLPYTIPLNNLIPLSGLDLTVISRSWVRFLCSKRSCPYNRQENTEQTRYLRVSHTLYGAYTLFFITYNYKLR